MRRGAVELTRTEHHGNRVGGECRVEVGEHASRVMVSQSYSTFLGLSTLIHLITSALQFSFEAEGKANYAPYYPWTKLLC